MKYLLTITLFLAFKHAESQNFQVLFQPVNPYYFSSGQIWGFTLINNSGSVTQGHLTLELYEENTEILSANTQNMTLSPGAVTISQAMINSTVFSYTGSAAAQQLQGSGFLPAGNYALCVEVKSLTGTLLANSCEEIHLNAFSPPILTYPQNNTSVPTPFPLLTWIPVNPATIRGLRYELVVWQSGATGGRNLGTGVSGRMADQIVYASQFNYNPTLPALSPGQQYSWQVKAFAGEIYLGASQIWQFTVTTMPQARDAEEDDTDSYRLIGVENIGAEYIAQGILRVGFINTANDTTLTYTITPYSEPDSVVGGLPILHLSHGYNEFDIDLESLETFVDDAKYIMMISDSNDRSYYLTFTYMDP